MKLKVIAERNFVNLTKDYVKFAGKKHNCKKCSIYSHYETIVQSEGNINNPTFMFIGEAPGKEEIEEVKPFVGKAGKLLRNELLKYNDVFNKKTTVITNLIPCRPLNDSFSAEHVEDDNYDILECMKTWLFEEIKLLKPKIIVTLGSQPLFYIRNQKEITENHGKWKFLKNFSAWSFATFHPSYVMRCQNDKSKKFIVQAFEDDIKLIVNLYKRFILNQPHFFILEKSEDTFSQYLEEISLLMKGQIND